MAILCRDFCIPATFGDIIAALPTIRQLGGGELIITDTNHPHTVRQSMKGDRYESLAPLLAAQPYISAVRFESNVPSAVYKPVPKPVADSKQYKATEKEARDVAASIGLFMNHLEPEEVLRELKKYGIPNASPSLQVAIKTGSVVPMPETKSDKPYITHDFTKFRDKFSNKEESLAHWQARYFGISNLDVSPWLTVDASEETKGRVVVARTLRYRNPEFDWKRVVEKYRDRIVFIGMDDEYEDFTNTTGAVERIIVPNLLKMAQLIKGADLLVSNQTCAFWLAAGLGTAIVQEVWEPQPNSVIPRSNARYFRTATDEY